MGAIATLARGRPGAILQNSPGVLTGSPPGGTHRGQFGSPLRVPSVSQASSARSNHMSRQNYFNTLTMAQKLDQVGRCRFMDRSEFANGVEKLRGKKVVIVGCGAQGLNQGLNMRDSGLDITYAL